MQLLLLKPDTSYENCISWLATVVKDLNTGTELCLFKVGIGCHKFETVPLFWPSSKERVKNLLATARKASCYRFIACSHTVRGKRHHLRGRHGITTATVCERSQTKFSTCTLKERELMSSGKNSDDVNSLFTSVFLYRCLYFPGLAL